MYIYICDWIFLAGVCCCCCCCCFLCGFIGSGQFRIVHFVQLNCYYYYHYFISLVTFVTCWVELLDFDASRDCCCVCVFAAADDDIVSHVGSDVFVADAFVVFGDVSHLSGAFNCPCSDDETKVDRFTDDIEKIGRKRRKHCLLTVRQMGPVHLCRMGRSSCLSDNVVGSALLRFLITWLWLFF